MLVGRQQAAAAVQTSSPQPDSPRTAAVVAAANLAAAMRMSQSNAMQHNSQASNQRSVVIVSSNLCLGYWAISPLNFISEQGKHFSHNFACFLSTT